MAERRSDRVYGWQWKWYHWDNQQFNNVDGARRWVKWAMKKYKVAGVPTVRAKVKGQVSFFRPIDWSIHLLKHHWNVAVALHESAHVIHFYYYGDNDDPHDEKWLGIFLWLLIESGLWPREAILASVKKNNLTYSNQMSPAAIKRKHPCVTFKNLRKKKGSK